MKYIEEDPDPFLQKGIWQIESTFSSSKSKVPVHSGYPTNYSSSVFRTFFDAWPLMGFVEWTLVQTWTFVQGLDPVKHLIPVKQHHHCIKNRISIYLIHKKHMGENFM